jgi:hypothetical protein
LGFGTIPVTVSYKKEIKVKSRGKLAVKKKKTDI